MITIQIILEDTTSLLDKRREQLYVVIQSDANLLIDYIRKHNSRRTAKELALLLDFSPILKMLLHSVSPYGSFIYSLILWFKENYQSLGAKIYPDSDSYDLVIKKMLLYLFFRDLNSIH